MCKQLQGVCVYVCVCCLAFISMAFQYLHIHIHIYVGAHAWVCMCVLKPEGNVSSFLSCPLPEFLRKGVSLVWSTPTGLGWLTTELQGAV